MKTVLKERGVWRYGKPKIWSSSLELTAPDIGLSLHCQIDNPDPSRKTNRVPNPQRLLGGECCATAILSAQNDFRSTHSRLQEIAEGAGHIFLLYPKFHCEPNWLEHYWGSYKHFSRKHYNYALAGKLRLGVWGTEC